jgi:hypothetical protein
MVEKKVSIERKNMNLSRMTALEIYSNPADIEFLIAQSEGKHAIMVTRGPGHRFKPLLSTEAVFESRATAVTIIRSVLDVALKEGKSAFDDALEMLDQETIDHIIQDLQEQGSCSTHLFLVV